MGTTNRLKLCPVRPANNLQFAATGDRLAVDVDRVFARRVGVGLVVIGVNVTGMLHVTRRLVDDDLLGRLPVKVDVLVGGSAEGDRAGALGPGDKRRHRNVALQRPVDIVRVVGNLNGPAPGPEAQIPLYGDVARWCESASTGAGCYG